MILRKTTVKGDCKAKFFLLLFEPTSPRLVAFPDEIRRLAKDAAGDIAKVFLEQFKYCEISLQLEESNYETHFGIGANESMMKHPEMDLKLIVFEVSHEFPVHTSIPQSIATNPKKQ